MRSSVGIRELKANLSRYLTLVKEGREIIAITDRGKVVAEIHPVESNVEMRMKELQALGSLSWNGKKPQFVLDPPENTSDILLSDIVVELRD